MQGKMSERNKVYSYQITHKYILLPLVGGEPLVCGIIDKSTSLFLESLANIEKAVWLNGFINKISNDKFCKISSPGETSVEVLNVITVLNVIKS